MKLVLILALFAGTLPAAAVAGSAIATDARALPSLAFEANRGQLDRRVQFVLRAPDYTAFFLEDRVTIGFRAEDGSASTVSMKLRGANRRAALEGVDEIAIRAGYLRGRDAARWVRNVPHYAKLCYRDIYPGVDLVFRREADRLEYDWVVAPGGDPSAIRVRFDSDASVVTDPGGDLVVSRKGFTWRHRKPSAYQNTGRARAPVSVAFRIFAGREGGFDVSGYDRTRSLVIDPVIVFSIVFGGHGANRTVNGFGDAGNAVAYNPALSSVYVAGTAVSMNFPQGDSKYQVHNEGSDAFVACFAIKADGTTASLSVYFLGGSLNDAATGVTFDPLGNVYVAGYTFSTDFPLVNAMQSTPGGGFVAKFTSDFSSLVYSTYVGSLRLGGPGSQPLAVAADTSGNAYVTGEADPALFTATPGAFQTTAAAGSYPAFVLKLGPSGKTSYATFLGNTDVEWGAAVAVDASSNAYVAGFTSSGFPTTPGVIQPACTANIPSGCTGAFVAKLNSAGTALLYSTFLGGGSGASANALAVDTAGNAYVAGSTLTPNPVLPGLINFPTTPGSFQQTTQEGAAAFISKLNPTGTALVYSTLVAGPGPPPAYEGGISSVNGIAIDAAGAAYLTGFTQQPDFPLSDPIQAVIGSEQLCAEGASPSPVGAGVVCGDAFVAKLSPDGSALEWSTYLGGSDWDSGSGIAASGGDVYVTGTTVSYDFPGYPSYTTCIYPQTFSGCAGYPVIPGSVFLAHLNESANAAGLSGPGVTSAASFATGVTPGALVTIFGTGFTNAPGVQTATCCPLPTELGGVSVDFYFGSGPAPLLAVSNEQINLVAPWEFEPGWDPSYTPVTVYVNGLPGLPVMAAFSPYQPALYTTGGTYAIAQHSSNYSLITSASPAQPGEVIILYANGLGPVQPAVAPGAAAPSNPPATTVVNPTVTIGGTLAEVSFSGLAPGFVSLYQLNVRVPQSTQPGNQAVVVSIYEGPGLAYTSPAAELLVGPVR